MGETRGRRGEKNYGGTHDATVATEMGDDDHENQGHCVFFRSVPWMHLFWILIFWGGLISFAMGVQKAIKPLDKKLYDGLVIGSLVPALILHVQFFLAFCETGPCGAKCAHRRSDGGCCSKFCGCLMVAMEQTAIFLDYIMFVLLCLCLMALSVWLMMSYVLAGTCSNSSGSSSIRANNAAKVICPVTWLALNGPSGSAAVNVKVAERALSALCKCGALGVDVTPTKGTGACLPGWKADSKLQTACDNYDKLIDGSVMAVAGIMTITCAVVGMFGMSIKSRTTGHDLKAGEDSEHERLKTGSRSKMSV